MDTNIFDLVTWEFGLDFENFNLGINFLTVHSICMCVCVVCEKKPTFVYIYYLCETKINEYKKQTFEE